MEWSELHEGMIIRWNPYFAREFDPITILIENKEFLNGIGEVYNTQVLSGASYSNYNYSELLIPTDNEFGSTRISRAQFERCKSDIKVSLIDDKYFIEHRLDRLVDSYKFEYERQKTWANRIHSKVKEFYEGSSH